MPDTDLIYLDNAATTQMDDRVMSAMLPYLTTEYGNASSLHSAGLNNRVAVDRSQALIAAYLGVNKDEVFFTSGATESNNLALWGVVKALQTKHSQIHIITSAIEHDAVLEPCQALEKQGIAVTYLPVNSRGVVSLEAIKKAIRPQTRLISIMYVNNEIGTIQPIAHIGRLVSQLNAERKNQIYLHTDATQALNACSCRLTDLKVDLMSFSGHKIYGPKGIGVLYLKKGTPLIPLFYGGHQQHNVRPGTYNVPGIVGLAEAIKILQQPQHQAEIDKIQTIKRYLIDQLQAKIPQVRLNGDVTKSIPHILNLSFLGVEGESLLLMLSKQKIAVSTGSACSAGSLKPSHVLTALGLKPEVAHGSLRMSLGRFNRLSQARQLVRVLPPLVAKLRSMSPLAD